MLLKWPSKTQKKEKTNYPTNMRRCKVILNKSDSFYDQKDFIEGKVLLEDSLRRFQFESDEDIDIFNTKTSCWTDRYGYRFIFRQPKITYL